jgi:TPR repeat protein
VNHSRSEFDKCAGVILLELCSERDDGPSSDRLYRYYSKGEHTIPNTEQSNYYFQKACEQGNPDSLADYLKSISSDTDYEQKIEQYVKEDCDDGKVCALIADIHKQHGNLDLYEKYIERSAGSGYAGSVQIWIDYWIKKDPSNLDNIEKFNSLIISKSMNAAITLARFYNERDYYHDRLVSFAKELVKNNSCYGEQICREYNIPLD